MFLFWSFAIFISSFNSIFSLQVKYIPNCVYNLKTLKYYNLSSTSASNEDINCDCLSPLPSNWTDFSNLNFTKIMICLLKCWKSDSTKFKIFVEIAKLIINTEILDKNISTFSKIGKLIYNITKNNINNDTIILQITNIINTTNFTDLMIELLNKPESWGNIDKNYTYNFLIRLCNIDGFIPLFKSLYYNSRTDILDLIEEVLLTYYPDIGNIFVLLRTKLKDILDDTLILAMDIIKNFKDRNRVLDIVAEFLIEHNNTYDKLKEVLLDDKMKAFYELIVFRDESILNQTKNLLLAKKETLEMLINLMGNRETLLLGVEILKRVNNITYLNEKLPIFITLAGKNNSIAELFTEFFFSLMFDTLNSKDTFSLKVYQAIRFFMETRLGEMNYTKYNISSDCIELFRYIFFNVSDNINSLFSLYFQKYLFDSSRKIGHFLTYDNCLDDSYKIKTPTKYIISPAFIIGLLDRKQQKEDNKDSSYYYKFDTLLCYCLPFAYRNETEEKNNNPMCSEEDYQKIFLILHLFLNDLYDLRITTFSINKSNKSPSSLHNFYGILGLLILGLPIIIYIFLFISGKVIANKQNKINEMDKSNKNLLTKNNELIEVNKKTKTKKIIFPKWYQYLNEFFNIKKNIIELFNFSLNITNYNNFKGMTYIKGIVGIFIILTVFGHTFIALLNLPVKGYGIWDFYNIMSSPFYFFLFIAYRYSPRILFSCSGYILIYKYLCYIEQEKELYFLKFVFLQSYKYILLVFFVIIIRYPLYYIVFLMRQSKRPTWEIFKHFIDRETNYLKDFFTFLFYPKVNDTTIKQNLILYYYIPINEVFFFILGTGLISLGYKFKLRIDVIICVLILLIYVLKIILYIVFKYVRIKAYSTTDYYLFDYGLNMIHPLFNLNYFLIGMFFGLINYSIQKGITDLEEKNNYQNILRLEYFENINDDDNDYDEESKVIKKMSTFSPEETNIDKIEININKVSKTDESLLKLSSNNNKLFINFNNTIKKSKNNRINDINDINGDSSEIFEKLILDENEIGKKKIEYSQSIKQMPFLIWPIKFSNFHKIIRNKLIINLVIIVAFILLIFFISAQFIFSGAKLKIEQYEQNLVDKLSFRKIISEIGLNIIFLLDIEIAIFIIHWVNFILYFKEVGIIKNFLNHMYWSIFIKSYFSFNLISVSVILFIFLITETLIKFNFGNIFLYSFIDLIVTLLFTIAFYSCFELPFKKIFKFFLKGKEVINNEENNDENDDEENNENEEEEHLKDENNEK